MRRAEAQAREVLKAARITEPPVPVGELAERHGARLTYEPFRGGISGMLFRGEGESVIGVNASHPETRQRFTIAHELGHLLLHESRPMIVDTYVRMRDATSSMGTQREEMEANAFAAELLMPADVVRQAADTLVGETGGRVGANRLVRDLAQSFGVSQQAMEIRLGTLGILSPLIVASG